MTEDQIIRILECLAPVLALMAGIAWIFRVLDKSGEALPHAYCTENPHEVTPGKDCICPVENCSICGEGR